MMNGTGGRRPWDSGNRTGSVVGSANSSNGNGRNLPKIKPSVAQLLAAEKALTYEERVKKALNLKPYLNYLGDLFSEKQSDSSGSDDETNAPVAIQLNSQLKVEDDSKCPGLTEAIHTLNLNIGDSRQRPYTQVKLEQGSSEAFSPSNCYSSLGLSPTSNEGDDHNVRDESTLPPLTDLELHNYLDKSTPGLNSPGEDYLMTFLGSGSESKRKRKWDSHSSSLCEMKPKCPSPGCSRRIPDLHISKAFGSVSGDLITEDTILPGLGMHETGIGEALGMKIKEDPDKLLLTDTYGDFRDCMKSSITHDKLNLNQTARADNDEECVHTPDRKRIEGIDGEDDDSLSDYMNITATSALALDTYFKFEAEEFTTAAESPMSPVSQILPTLSIHGPLNPMEIVDASIDDGGMSVTSDIFGGNSIRALSAQKQAKMVQFLNMKRRRIYVHMCRKEVLRVARIRSLLHKEVLCRTRQLATMCSTHLQQDGTEEEASTLNGKDVSEIRKSFGLERTMKDSDNILAEKVEILIPCPLTSRQRSLSTEIKEKVRIKYSRRRSFSVHQLKQSEIGNLMNSAMQLRKVYNHPDLFEKREVKSPFYMSLRSKYTTTLFNVLYNNEFKRRLLTNHFCIYNPVNTHRAIFRNKNIAEDLASEQTTPSEWAFIRILGINSKELFDIALGGFESRWIENLKQHRKLCDLYKERLWHEKEGKTFALGDFILYPDMPLAFPFVEDSEMLKDLVFVSPTVPVYSFLDHKIYFTGSRTVEPFVRSANATLLPKVFHQITPKVMARRRSLMWRKPRSILEPKSGFSTSSVTEHIADSTTISKRVHFDMNSLYIPCGFSGVTFPSKDSFLMDSGKLCILDAMLSSLETTKSKVVIYSQMQGMLNILQEFIVNRKWHHVRLTNSGSQQTDFLDSEFSKPEFFIVLVWTREKNLQPNLSNVDTVIFYDCDWNPVVNCMALDRVYGTDRTKKLTVYQLVCDKTIESKILEQMREKVALKNEGKNSRGRVESAESMEPLDLITLLLDDEEINPAWLGRESGDQQSKVFGFKMKGETDFRPKMFKEEFVRKFRNIDMEPGSSVASGSSISATGSSPANSERYLGEDCDVELGDDDDGVESLEDDVDEETEVEAADDIDCVDGILPCSMVSIPASNIMDWNMGSISDYDEDLCQATAGVPSITRGIARRGRPPIRVRMVSRDFDGSRRGRTLGRPRMNRIGPLNQGVRGRKPGRPPLAKKAEVLQLHGLQISLSDNTPLTPISTSDSL